MTSPDQPARILVVDDDPPYRDMLLASLTGAGYQAVAAASGQDALDKQAAAEPPFDVIVLDVIMPEMDGIETLRALRQVRPALPVIIVSGGGNLSADCYLLAAKRLGAAATLAKPFHSNELIELIEQCRRRPD